MQNFMTMLNQVLRPTKRENRNPRNFDKKRPGENKKLPSEIESVRKRWVTWSLQQWGKEEEEEEKGERAKARAASS